MSANNFHLHQRLENLTVFGCPTLTRHVRCSHAVNENNHEVEHEKVFAVWFILEIAITIWSHVRIKIGIVWVRTIRHCLALERTTHKLLSACIASAAVRYFVCLLSNALCSSSSVKGLPLTLLTLLMCHLNKRAARRVWSALVSPWVPRSVPLWNKKSRLPINRIPPPATPLSAIPAWQQNPSCTECKKSQLYN